MTKKLFSIIILILLFASTQAQKIGEWNIISSFSNPQKVLEGKQQIYFLVDTYLFAYNKEDKECRNLNKINKLSDTNINNIFIDPTGNTLFVAYNNSNIDIIKGESLVNLPFIKEKSMVSSKTINHVFFMDKKMYLATDFGIVVINRMKNEITETYNFGKKVNSIYVNDSQLFAFFDKGIYTATHSDNLFDLNSWEIQHNHSIKKTEVLSDDLLCALDTNNISYIFNTRTQILTEKDSDIGDLSKTNNGVMLQKGNSLYFYNNKGETEKKLDVNSLVQNNSFFTSNNSNSILWKIDYKGLSSYQTRDEITQVEGPITYPSTQVRKPYNIYVSQSKLYIFNEGAGIYNSSQSIFTELSILDFNLKKWTHITDKENKLPIKTHPIGALSGVYNIIENKNDPNTFYLGTAHEGLYEIKNYHLNNYYNHTNSTIEQYAGFFTKISGLQYDKDGNIWMLNQGSTNKASIKIFNPKESGEKAWKAISYGDLTGRNHEQLLIPKNSKYKWLINSDQNNNLQTGFVFVFDDNGTIENSKDDKTIYFKTFYDQDGKITENKRFYCITEDKKGALWIGSDRGVYIINSPNKVFQDNFTCTRIKIPRNDGTNLADFLLEKDEILCITIDGANRKWIGTMNSGIFLISEDGLETIHHFTTENSFLPSNEIISIGVHPENGMVYIATENGVVSYRSDAIEGKEDYSNVYAFPNPVRPEHTGPITITGLMDNSLVKITDTQSNLIFEGFSVGGQITWNATNRDGKRVKTGVYLVYGSSYENENKNGVVTKILIVN